MWFRARPTCDPHARASLSRGLSGYSHLACRLPQRASQPTVCLSRTGGPPFDRRRRRFLMPGDIQNGRWRSLSRSPASYLITSQLPAARCLAYREPDGPTAQLRAVSASGQVRRSDRDSGYALADRPAPNLLARWLGVSRSRLQGIWRARRSPSAARRRRFFRRRWKSAPRFRR